MKIRTEIEVFPDAEYCSTNLEWSDRKTCDYFDGDNYLCQLFRCSLDDDQIDGGPQEQGVYVKKCDQCKADYLKAKREEPTDRITIGAYMFDCFKSRLYFDTSGVEFKGKILAELICDRHDRLKFSDEYCCTEDQHPISTHEGTFNHIGMIRTIGMFKGDAGKMHIEIEIMIVQ